LTAKEPGKDLRLVAGKRHDPEGDILIRGMALHGLVIREEDQPLSIRRRVRKPVYKLVVESHLLRVAPIRLRSPHFHAAASFRIEVDVVAVRGIVQPVIKSRGVGKPSFFPRAGLLRGNRINIKLALSFSAIDQRLPIRRPAMPIRRALAGNLFRFPSCGRQDIDQRSVSGLVTNGEPFPIRREAMVIVAMSAPAVFRTCGKPPCVGKV